MFNSSKKTDYKKQNEELKSKEGVNDFITHNMPSPHLFSGQTFSHEDDLKIKKTSVIKEAHHQVGILIIAGGLVLIVAIIYIGYLLLIKPVLTPQEEIVENQAPVIEKVATIVEPEIIPPVSEIVAPVEVEIATTTTEIASTSENLLAEETPIFEIKTEINTTDTDADGLTDNEEKIIGTDPNKADTDNDGYLDLAEIKSGYDPLVAGQKLSDDSSILIYQIDLKARVLYPTFWEVTKSDLDNTVIFADADKAFIQISYQENSQKLKPLEWFNQEFAGVTPGESISGKFWQGIYTQDGLAAYVFNQDYSKVYSFSVSPLSSDTSSLVLFKLMINNLLID